MSFRDPQAAFDAPDAPDLSYVEEAGGAPSAPLLDATAASLVEEIEAAIDFEEPALEPLSDEATPDDADETPALGAAPDWRVRARNGVEYAFADEMAVRRFALRGTVSANDLVSQDGGRTWSVAWQLGMGTDDFGDLFEFTSTSPTILQPPKPPLVHWPRVGAIAVVLSLGTAVGLRLAHVEASRSSGVFESQLPAWYDQALGSVAQTPRPHLALPPRPEPVAPPPPPPPETKEMAVRLSTAADHAAVGKDALTRGAWEQAATAYRKALQLDPRNGAYKIGLADAARHLLESAKAAQAAVDAAP
jgi:hypothetical protein